ncbi:uncharacterized protein MICPUCDRAFT_56780 [Micromonas pusilla CCMP1545]|uniref:Predicted protein n=1 Tax=Micromonas pusilla (strain CCMP1545) TaxID=564608 RepID=C1MN48_MICPC|nr:uncharacterized protein MICPUCDRAFT_56780 [Micromonas pusilla CCMP1545]EEH58687.1 predicted protein [Micromonas pusilla CCMP1545]|eukprot:XP_003057042.1 predicted protein [Micromonas pusilla CCMP1545]
MVCAAPADETKISMLASVVDAAPQTSTHRARVPECASVARRERAILLAPSLAPSASVAPWRWRRHASNETGTKYDVANGPGANLLRILRDAEKPLSVAQIYASVEERDREAQGVHSKRHMKGLLRWMKSIQRVYTLPAKKAFEEDIVSLRASGKGHVFKLTEKGEKHIAKIDANAGIERPAAADGGAAGAASASPPPPS